MTLYAETNPNMLTWARNASGLSLAESASKVGTTEARMAMWESGEAKPTLRQLRLTAKAYRRPTAFFFLKVPPKEPKELPDFRHLPDRFLETSPNLLYEIRVARSRRDTALDLYNRMGDSPIQFAANYSLQDGVSKIASGLRNLVDISIAVQSSWRDHYEGLKAWIKAIEETGVLVFQFSGVDVHEARGFSIDEKPLPAIALNAKDKPRGRIFTLAHELAHIALNTGGLCDLHSHAGHSNDIEPTINQIAAEFLVPSALILEHQVVKENRGMEWSDSDLVALSNYFMVSQEMILRRLLTLNLTTNDFYVAKRREYLEYYKKAKSESGFLYQHKKIVRNNGHNYTNLVVGAYYGNLISANDLSRYLGSIKLKHLGAVERELGILI